MVDLDKFSLSWCLPGSGTWIPKHSVQHQVYTGSVYYGVYLIIKQKAFEAISSRAWICMKIIIHKIMEMSIIVIIRAIGTGFEKKSDVL